MHFGPTSTPRQCWILLTPQVYTRTLCNPSRLLALSAIHRKNASLQNTTMICQFQRVLRAACGLTFKLFFHPHCGRRTPFPLPCCPCVRCRVKGTITPELGGHFRPYCCLSCRFCVHCLNRISSWKSASARSPLIHDPNTVHAVHSAAGEERQRERERSDLRFLSPYSGPAAARATWGGLAPQQARWGECKREVRAIKDGPETGSAHRQ